MAVVAMVSVDGRESRRERIEAEGRRLIGFLQSLPLESRSMEGLPGLYLEAAPGLESGSDFSYLAIRDGSGELQGEVARKGSVVPSFELPPGSSSWHGERSVRNGLDGRDILEFRAPILNSGDLAGFVTVGYFEPGYGIGEIVYRRLAALCLPVLLLGAFAHLLFRAQVKPIQALARRIEAPLEKGERGGGSATLVKLAEQFRELIESDSERIRNLEEMYLDKVTSDKVRLYQVNRLEQILDRLPDAVFVLDDSCVVTYANGRVETLLGVKKEAMVGSRFQSWCMDEELTAFFKTLQGHCGHLHRSEKMAYSPAHLEDCKVSLHASPLAEGRGAQTGFGTLVVCRDVTSEEQARQARDDFVASLSHEMKSPLNVLKMYGEMLLGEEGEKEAFRVEAVNAIADEVERLVALVNSLLGIARIEMGSIALERKRIKVRELLKDAFESLARSDRRGGLDFRLDLPHEMSHLFIDKELMRVAVNNLLTNAIKYSRDRGAVSLIAAESDENITITVADEGIGISAEDQKHIFEKFFRSESRELDGIAGHGLGLSLAKSIVELHQGRLTVKSDPGEGSTFSIVLDKSGGLVREQI